MEGWSLKPLSSGLPQSMNILKSHMERKRGKLSEMVGILHEGYYFRPSASNFPVLDAAVMGGEDVFWLQMTVESSHPIKAAAAAKILATIPQKYKVHMVFVVDPRRVDQIKDPQSLENCDDVKDADLRNRLDTMPQWVLVLGLPERNPHEYGLKSESRYFHDQLRELRRLAH